MRIIPAIAALLLVSGAAFANEPAVCSTDGAVRVEPGPSHTYPDQKYFITFEGKRSEFHDVGSVGTGIPARVFGDNSDRTIAIYWETDDAPKGGSMVIVNSKEVPLKPCK